MKKIRKKTLGFLSGICGVAIALLCGTSCGNNGEMVMYGPPHGDFEEVEDSTAGNSGDEAHNLPESPEKEKHL